MRGLRGDFSTMPLKDIVLYLGNKRASGTLFIDRAGIHKEVRLRDGAACNASSNQPREYLGQLLINMGHLTEDQFMKAYETQKETKIFIGKILVMIGLVPEETVHSVLNFKLRETLLDAFAWPAGEFTFTPDDLKDAALDGLDMQVDLLDIFREAEFRETAWQAIRAAFPHGNVRLTVDEAKLAGLPRAGSIDAKIVQQIHEGHTIDDMLLALHATDFFLYQHLYAMYRLGAVKVDARTVELKADAEVRAPEPPQDLASAAKAFLDARNWMEAEPLARRLVELSPSQENRALLHAAEQGLLAQLRTQFLSRSRIPSLTVASAQVKAMSLSAPEKYLLSRIDGARDLQAIVHVSPLQELEALKLFRQFVDSGLVRLTP